MGVQTTVPVEPPDRKIDGGSIEQKSMPPVSGGMEIIGAMHVFGDEGPVYVVANTSAALDQGAQTIWEDKKIGQYDAYDAGPQMLAFAPDGSMILVQMPQDKLTEEDTERAGRNFGLSVDSMRALGVEKQVNVQFVANMHDAITEIAEAGPVRVAPMFPSVRTLGKEHEAAKAAARFNNKPEFIRALQEAGIRTPVTVFFDEENYPETGYPSPEALVALAQQSGSDALFFKQDVSAAGFGVERVPIADMEKVEEAYTKWVTKMQEARANESTEWDFHVQVGEVGINMKNGDVESPCIIGTISEDGTVDILQVAIQRFKNKVNHIGNVIDLEYEAAFLEEHGAELEQVFRVLAANGVRGHIGIDVIALASGDISFIEVNPRLNGNSALRVVRNHLPEGTPVVSNNSIKPTEAGIESMEQLRQYFYDGENPNRPAVVVTRAPRYAGDSINLVFINDPNQELERQIEQILNGIAA